MGQGTPIETIQCKLCRTITNDVNVILRITKIKFSVSDVVLQSPWFSECIEQASRLLGVQRLDKNMESHSKQNQVLIKGCEELG